MGGRPPTVVPCHYRASSSVVLPSCRPAVLSSCRHRNRLASRPVLLSPSVVLSSCRLLSCAVVASGVIVWRLVTRLPGCLVICSRLVILALVRAFHILAHLSRDPFPLFTRSKFISTVNIFLFSKLVSILSFPAPILQTRCIFWQDYSLASY